MVTNKKASRRCREASQATVREGNLSLSKIENLQHAFATGASSEACQAMISTTATRLPTFENWTAANRRAAFDDFRKSTLELIALKPPAAPVMSSSSRLAAVSRNVATTPP